jgi:hypothetical protein
MDPGAEDVINGQHLGGWYDQSGWENALLHLLTGLTSPFLLS